MAYHRTALSTLVQFFYGYAVIPEGVNRLARVKLTDLDPHYDGASDEIEVPDEIVEAYQQLRRKEKSLERKKQRHHALYTTSTSMMTNSITYSESSCEDLLLDEASREELLLALKSLSPIQARRVFAVYFLGMSRADVAKMEKVSRAAVTICLRGALKKIFLQKFSKQA